MKALIVVDIQNDFCKGGSLAVKGSEKVIPVINKMIDFFNKNNMLVVATKDWHPDNHGSFAINSNGKVGEVGELNGLPQIWWPIHCVQNSIGAEFHPYLRKIDNVIYKGQNPNFDSYSGFFDNGKTEATKLHKFLSDRKIKELYILGLATDYCVKYTVLDALELGYEVYLIEDGSAGVNISPDDSKKAIEEMREKGAKIIKSSEILA